MISNNKRAKGDDFFKITSQKIKIEEAIKKVSGKEAGALVTFIGTVRKASRGRDIKHLEHEAYNEMALKEIRKIAEVIKERWNIRKLAIVHRTGKLNLGEASILIAVSAPHRKEAYQASKYAIEKLKESTPIWKKEAWGSGEEWIVGS